MGRVHTFSTYTEDEVILEKIRILYPNMGKSRRYCMIFREWLEGLDPERTKKLLNTDWDKLARGSYDGI